MGRRPGVWQNLIIDKVATGEQFYLVDLLPKGYTTTQYFCLYQAARTLEAAGAIIVVRYLEGIRKLIIQGPIGPPRPVGGTSPAIRPTRLRKGQPPRAIDWSPDVLRISHLCQGEP